VPQLFIILESGNLLEEVLVGRGLTPPKIEPEKLNRKHLRSLTLKGKGWNWQFLSTLAFANLRRRSKLGHKNLRLPNVRKTKFCAKSLFV